MAEFTTVLVLPDAVKRGLIAEIVGRFERRGFGVIGLKMVHIARGAAEARYAGEADAAARAGALVAGPALALVLHGAGVIAMVQSMVGNADTPGTIRGDLANGTSSALAEAAEDAQSARAGASTWFEPNELTEPVLHSCEKLVDKIRTWAATTDQPYISFEYFPPKSADGVANLQQTIALMARQAPLFLDFTWGAGGSTSELTIQLCADAWLAHGIDVNMHLTCTNQAPALCGEALAAAKRCGIRNIVALRGDPPKGQAKWEAVAGGFNCALDLVASIRAEFGDWFGVQVSGYPEGHPDAIKPVADLGRPLSEAERKRLVEVDGVQYVCSDADFEKELDYLAAKVSAGSDCIITQMFFDFEVFEAFVQAVRARGIDAPILPGIMLITAYGGFTRMTGFCKSRVPERLRALCEAHKDDADGFKEMGLSWTVALCQQLTASRLVEGLHFYTLNQSANTLEILRRLKLLKEAPRETVQDEDVLEGIFVGKA